METFSKFYSIFMYSESDSESQTLRTSEHSMSFYETSLLPLSAHKSSNENTLNKMYVKRKFKRMGTSS